MGELLIRMYVPESYYRDKPIPEMYLDEFRSLLGLAVKCRRLRQDDMKESVLEALNLIYGEEG